MHSPFLLALVASIITLFLGSVSTPSARLFATAAPVPAAGSQLAAEHRFDGRQLIPSTFLPCIDRATGTLDLGSPNCTRLGLVPRAQVDQLRRVLSRSPFCSDPYHRVIYLGNATCDYNVHDDADVEKKNESRADDVRKQLAERRLDDRQLVPSTFLSCIDPVTGKLYPSDPNCVNGGIPTLLAEHDEGQAAAAAVGDDDAAASRRSAENQADMMLPSPSDGKVLNRAWPFSPNWRRDRGNVSAVADASAFADAEADVAADAVVAAAVAAALADVDADTAAVLLDRSDATTDSSASSPLAGAADENRVTAREGSDGSESGKAAADRLAVKQSHEYFACISTFILFPPPIGDDRCDHLRPSMRTGPDGSSDVENAAPAIELHSSSGAEYKACLFRYRKSPPRVQRAKCRRLRPEDATLDPAPATAPAPAVLAAGVDVTADADSAAGTGADTGVGAGKEKEIATRTIPNETEVKSAVFVRAAPTSTYALHKGCVSWFRELSPAERMLRCKHLLTGGRPGSGALARREVVAARKRPDGTDVKTAPAREPVSSDTPGRYAACLLKHKGAAPAVRMTKCAHLRPEGQSGPEPAGSYATADADAVAADGDGLLPHERSEGSDIGKAPVGKVHPGMPSPYQACLRKFRTLPFLQILRCGRLPPIVNRDPASSPQKQQQQQQQQEEQHSLNYVLTPRSSIGDKIKNFFNKVKEKASKFFWKITPEWAKDKIRGKVKDEILKKLDEAEKAAAKGKAGGH